MSAEVSAQEISQIPEDVRFQYLDALIDAFLSSELSDQWDETEFQKRVAIPFLFPELYPDEGTPELGLHLDGYYSTYALEPFEPLINPGLEEVARLSSRTELVENVRALLGWSALGLDAQIIDFPVRYTYPALDTDAQILPFPTPHS